MYTKGKWKAQIPDFSIEFTFGVVAENDYFSEVVSQLKGYNYEESVANAHLIAAAPDMYEALKELTEIMAGVIEAPDVMELDSFTLQPAREALAKAEEK